MNAVNLIPKQRREAKARKVHLIRLISGLGVYGVILLGGYLLCLRYVASDGRSLDGRTTDVAAGLNSSNRQVLVLAGELAEANRKLQAVQAVGRQPDWGGLLKVLAENMGERTVLDFCRLRRVRPVAQTAADSDPGRAASGSDDEAPKAATDAPLLLELTGWAEAQADVSAFLLRLEQTGLFDKVKLVRTSRRPFLDRTAVAFQLECVLGQSEGAIQ